MWKPAVATKNGSGVTSTYNWGLSAGEPVDRESVVKRTSPDSCVEARMAQRSSSRRPDVSSEDYTSLDKEDRFGSRSPVGGGRPQPKHDQYDARTRVDQDISSTVNSSLRRIQSTGSRETEDSRSGLTHQGNESRRVQLNYPKKEARCQWDPNNGSGFNSPRRDHSALGKSNGIYRTEPKPVDSRPIHKTRSSPHVSSTSGDVARNQSRKQLEERNTGDVVFYTEEQTMDLQRLAMSKREPRDTKRLAEVKRENEMLKQELQKAKEDLAKMSSMERKQQDLEKDHQLVEQQLKEATQKNQELEQQIQDANERLHEYEKAIRKIRSRSPKYHDLQQQIGELQRQSERQISEHKSSCQRVMRLYEDEIERLMNQMDTLAKRYADLLSHVEDGVTQQLVSPSFSLTGFYFGET